MYLVVGCGLTGAIIAERIANVLDAPVVIVDRRGHIAGNIFDYRDAAGITVHKYGPHAFHTNSKKVWDYLSGFTKWKPYFHKVQAFIDGQIVPLPFNLNSMHQLFPQNIAEETEKKLLSAYGFDESVSILELLENENFGFLAKYVYEKVFYGYTKKQWGVEPDGIDRSVLSRVPIVIGKNNCYFQDKYQAVPIDGYTKMVERMLDNPLIETRLGCDYRDIKDINSYEKIIYTGMIDEFFGFKLGVLPYRSLIFDFHTLEQQYLQECAQVNYPNNFDFTRVTEFKYFLNEKSDKTTIAYEYPVAFEYGMNDPYYPVPNSQNQALYDAYATLNTDNKIIFAGRLGEYRYYNMDRAVERALEIFETKVANG